MHTASSETFYFSGINVFSLQLIQQYHTRHRYCPPRADSRPRAAGCMPGSGGFPCSCLSLLGLFSNMSFSLGSGIRFSQLALLTTLNGCIKGHQSWYNVNILHIDISFNKLMINEDNRNHSRPSFLIDLDLAIERNQEGALLTIRTR
jgi:hypothetical protein